MKITNREKQTSNWKCQHPFMIQQKYQTTFSVHLRSNLLHRWTQLDVYKLCDITCNQRMGEFPYSPGLGVWLDA